MVGSALVSTVRLDFYNQHLSHWIRMFVQSYEDRRKAMPTEEVLKMKQGMTALSIKNCLKLFDEEMENEARAKRDAS